MQMSRAGVEIALAATSLGTQEGTCMNTVQPEIVSIHSYRSPGADADELVFDNRPAGLRARMMRGDRRE